MKRFTDILFALILLPFALFLCLFAAIAIRFETPGNPFFLQYRVGQNQKVFTLCKLRSMASGTRHAGSHEIGEAHITKVGRFIRRVKFDELPQILNVLSGDMSFVGPRPCLPIQSELIQERSALRVFDVRPGITGPAQIRGIDMSTPKLLAETDAAYIRDRSFVGDIKLIIQTAIGGGSGDAATRI